MVHILPQATAARCTVTHPPTIKLFFDLPAPTSVNDLWSKGMRVTEKYEAWRQVAMSEIMVQRARMSPKSLPFSRAWGARIRLSIDDPADIDNRVKALFDIFVKMRTVPDDKFCAFYTIGVSDRVPLGRCHVSLWNMPGVRRG